MKTLNIARICGIAATILTLLFVLALTASCNSGPDVPEPRYDPGRTIQKYLSIEIRVSGLKDETVLVTTHVYDMSTGKEYTEWKRTGNGTSEKLLRESEKGNLYTIIAEAEGHTVQPESYKVRIAADGTTVITNSETREEVSQLDFQFTPDNASSAQTPKTTKITPEPGGKGILGPAASFPAMTLDELITHSDTIVLGKVTDILPARKGKDPMGMMPEIIYQDVIVQTERYLYGTPESGLVAIRVLGGKVGDMYFITDVDPEFTVGEEVLLFLYHPQTRFIQNVPEGIDSRSIYKVTASIPGKYELENEIITNYKGEKVNIATIEESIASIHGGE